MKRQKTWIWLAALLVLALGLAIGMEALQVATQPREHAGYVTIREAGEFDLEQCVLTDAEYKKESITTQEGSEILYDLGENTEMPGLQIRSKKTLKTDVPITVYYAADGEEFAEERAVTFTAEAGSTVWDAGIPAGQYRRVRIMTGGKLTIRSIIYSEAMEEPNWIQEPMHWRRVWILWPILFLVLLFLRRVHALKRFVGVLAQAWRGLSEDWKNTAAHLGTFVLAGILGFFAAKWLFLGGLGEKMTLPRNVFCLSAALVTACLATFRKTLGVKPEVFFVILCLCTGCIMVAAYNTLVGWDEGLHLDEAMNESYLGEERLSKEEYRMIATFQEMDPEDEFLSAETRGAWLARQQEIHEQGVELIQRKPVEMKQYYELLPGLGLYLGRVLGLHVYAVFCMGKLFGLLTYTVCGYFAIRHLKSGKMLAAACLLIPSAVFYASVYTYDTGVNAFTALGMAWLFGEWQRPEKKLTWGDTAIILGTTFFGCLAKAIYCPLLIIGVMLPKSKFADRRNGRTEDGISRSAFIAVTCCVILALAATFLVPMVTGGTESDTRNGSDVDAYGQIRNILSDPFGYAGLLLRFLRGYLNISKRSQVLTLFGNLGTASYGTLLSVVLVALALTDKKREDRALSRNIPARLVSLALMFGITCLIATSMYIIYTPVAKETIDGVQPRYLIPLLFPTLMMAGTGLLGEALKIDKPWKQRLYNGVTFAVLTFILYNDLFERCISRFIS